MRRAAMGIGTLLIMMLPVTAAMSADATRPEIPVAITQPVGQLTSMFAMDGPALSEPGLILIVGSGLLGLAGIVRRTTGV